ncbi:YobI family P-loop NTPase [Aeromonas veronii]
MCDMMVCQKNTSSEPWNLVPLTPEYLEAEHGRYVAAIESALADEQIRNIALSGNYGVGKSSILQEVARRQKDRVVELSLSTLAPIEMSQLDESVPKQATTQTNRIQQEIVKQLLYREEPSKTPGSRFQRIQRFRWPREIGMAIVLGFVFAIIFLLTGWTDQIVASLTILKNVGDWAHAGVLGLGAGAALLVRWWFYGKFHIKQFSAASATVTLDDHSVSYFDQYLDEIVYFFEVSEHDVVIFEDIDRFNDSYIFETLRALNTLLNTAPQIKNSVRFIYAIKDSIFDQIGLEAEGRKLEVGIATTDDPALVESARANRTKFFDMVIPVVPFITHRSARNLATQLLGKIDHDVDPALLDLAAQYVPDMRLLKNIRNEFIVFRDRIFSGEGEQLQLSETDLFAMMLYKSTHLTDFEKIRLGKSNLDFLYKLSREMVVSNIKRLESECGKIRYRLARIDGVTTRSKQLGEKLILHIQRTAEAVGHQWEYYTFSFSSQSSLSRDDLKGVSFWASFVEADADDAVLICRNNNNYRNPVSFSRKNLAVALDDPLDAESWNEGEHKILTEQIEDNQNDIKFLRSADLSDLVKHPEFLVIYEKSELSLDEISKSILQLGLAYQLVRAGYLNRNFTLYTSTFHGDRVSPAATNFIIHHIERDLMDEHFELSPDDVDAVVRERGKNALKESALYNIAILDHLLVADLKGADIMVSSLAELGHNQTRFLQSYLSAGKQSSAFIKRFTAVCTRVLVYLVSQVELEEGLRLQLVDMALAHLTSSKLRTDSAVIKYLSTHYSEFMSLTSDSTESAIAERIGNLYADSSIKVSSLKHLGKSVCSSFVSRNMYEITHENLTIVISNTHTVALDVIRTANNTTYEYVLAHLGAYLNNTKGLTTTIDANEYFNIVIEDVLGREESLLGDVIERAATNCIITDLNDVSNTAWPALAEHLRFPATFNNISCYFEVFNSIDSHLAKVLTHAGCITEIKKNEDKLKEKIAVAVLEAKVDIPSPVLRVELVTSLDLGEFLNVEDVAPEAGELFTLRLKNKIIADEFETYAHLATLDWSTRHQFICASEKFVNYMAPELVGTDLARFLTSNDIDSAIKMVIIDQSVEYVEVGGAQGLEELAQFAAINRHQLPSIVLHKMAQAGIDAQLLVQLLEPNLVSIPTEQLFKILTSVGGDYAKLTTVGYDKPRIPNTSSDRALLGRLKQDGIVGKYDEQGGLIKVNKRYK